MIVFTAKDLRELEIVVKASPTAFFVSHAGDGRSSITIEREKLLDLIAQAQIAISLASAVNWGFAAFAICGVIAWLSGKI